MLIVSAIVFIIAVITLFFAARQDLKSREIDRFVFIPLVMVGAGASFFNGNPYAVILYPVFLFATLFFRLPIWLYILVGGASTVLAVFLSPTGYLLYFVILLAIYLLGTGEKYFGIGDIKAMIALTLGFNYPLIYDLVAPSYMQSLLPFDFSFLFTVAIVSLGYSLYVTLTESRGRTDGKPLSPYIPYDEEKYHKNPVKYEIRERQGDKVMIYQIPTLVPIFIGFLIVSFLGVWFL